MTENGTCRRGQWGPEPAGSTDPVRVGSVSTGYRRARSV